MNQIANIHHKPPIAAPLDLTDDRQRTVMLMLERTHGGRWPKWHGYAMQRLDDALIELAEWVPSRRTVEPRRFNVLTWTWDLTTIGVTWQRQHLTRAQAVAMFAEAKQHNRLPVGDIGLRITA